MRYLVVTAFALLSWSWAQQDVNPRQTRVFKRNPQIEAITRNAQLVRINLDEGLSPGSRPQRRITTTDFGANLGWLKPSQDADTVPTTPNTLPDYAGDTLLANNAGQDIDPNIPSDCHHTFFDSLVAIGGAYLIWTSPEAGRITFLGNYLHQNPEEEDADTVFFIGGGVAERYDIDATNLNNQDQSVYIKGVAALIQNNRNSPASLRCNPRTGEVTGGPWTNDNAYTVAYQLLDTIEVDYPIDRGRDLRHGTYPDTTANGLIAEITRPLTNIRISHSVADGQCVSPSNSFLELLDHAYFDQPIEVQGSKSFYVALRFDLYVPDVDELLDTLYTRLGPAYQYPGGTCITADTLFAGRNLLLTPGFRRSTSTFIYPNNWYPQYYLFRLPRTGRGLDLNFLIFPIIYTASISTSAPVVRSGSIAFSAPYPNPAVDCLHLNVESPAATTLRLALYTSEGRLVRSWNRTLQSGTSTVAVDLEVPAGAYLLQAQSPYGAATFWVNVVK
jgi:hypothetical protein